MVPQWGTHQVCQLCDHSLYHMTCNTSGCSPTTKIAITRVPEGDGAIGMGTHSTK